MNCLIFRKTLLSEPGAESPELADHERGCATCAAFAKQTRVFDTALKSAMQINVPDSLESRILLHRASQRPHIAPRVWALAATLLLGIGVATGLWLGGGEALALPDDVMAHVKHEPDLLVLQGGQVEFTKVNAVLQRGNVSLNGDIGTVQHAGLCSFRGNLVPHLVVTGKRGPVTVLLLADEQVGAAEPIDEEGFQGVIIPAGRGSIAIVGMKDEPLEGVKTRLTESVEWTI